MGVELMQHYLDKNQADLKLMQNFLINFLQDNPFNEKLSKDTLCIQKQLKNNDLLKGTSKLHSKI